MFAALEKYSRVLDVSYVSPFHLAALLLLRLENVCGFFFPFHITTSEPYRHSCRCVYIFRCTLLGLALARTRIQTPIPFSSRSLSHMHIHIRTLHILPLKYYSTLFTVFLHLHLVVAVIGYIFDIFYILFEQQSDWKILRTNLANDWAIIEGADSMRHKIHSNSLF